jgi:hypothetical protein
MALVAKLLNMGCLIKNPKINLNLLCISTTNYLIRNLKTVIDRAWLKYKLYRLTLFDFNRDISVALNQQP